jgi:sugar/nucleoside kinase (ribokinase family)
VSEVLGIDPSTNPEAAIESLARSIREKLKLHGVVIHPRSCAAAAIAEGSTVSSAKFAGPFVAEPKLSTGAGDEFNAGFSLARLAGLSVEQALACGTGASGYYVRNAGSPTLEQLADFLDELPPPQSSK